MMAVDPDLLAPGSGQHQDLAPAEAGKVDCSHWVAVVCHHSLKAVCQQAPELDLV